MNKENGADKSSETDSESNLPSEGPIVDGEKKREEHQNGPTQEHGGRTILLISS
jgi:hypothetical protein